MKIGIIGASGRAGSRIMEEALSRDHEVTAIVRNAGKLSDPRASVLEKDIFELAAEDLKPFDVIVNAFAAVPGQEHLHVEAGNVLIKALRGTSDTRLIVVGGAGSLFADEGKKTRLMDTPQFPAEYYPTAKNQGDNLLALQKTDSIKWTFVSPAIFFDPDGKRTGSYQKGKDHPLVNSKGESYISYADYAIAIVDEIEQPEHVNERFTVVSESE